MKKIILQVFRLFFGLFLFALGVVMTLNANIGVGCWDVLNQGIVRKVPITLGQANIAVGAVLLIINCKLGERIGWSSVANMIFIGIFMDILLINDFVPMVYGGISSVLMILLGLFIIGIGSYLYIGVGLGTGPRDGLMVAFTKRTNKSVRFIRNSIEICVSIIGYMLGGFVGVGTVIISLSIGYFVQFAFKLFRFDVKVVKHRFIDEDIKFLKNKFFRSKDIKNKEIEENN
ncbi:membrane protein [Clostridium sp. HMP27]|uniref:YczE/YyaS/YitT family protein n=1 Tax=Clostridium sp. HMP27 TaxID=1487921 RepID=UPI00052C5A24|nr:membrane protein [Clostridium sp. HMP27]KGK84254.1 membrane protein [Clostridium sp. HMP27]